MALATWLPGEGIPAPEIDSRVGQRRSNERRKTPALVGKGVVGVFGLRPMHFTRPQQFAIDRPIDRCLVAAGEHEHILLITENLAAGWNILPLPKRLAADRIDGHDAPPLLEANITGIDRPKRIGALVHAIVEHDHVRRSRSRRRRGLGPQDPIGRRRAEGGRMNFIRPSAFILHPYPGGPPRIESQNPGPRGNHQQMAAASGQGGILVVKHAEPAAVFDQRNLLLLASHAIANTDFLPVAFEAYAGIAEEGPRGPPKSISQR